MLQVASKESQKRKFWKNVKKCLNRKEAGKVMGPYCRKLLSSDRFRKPGTRRTGTRYRRRQPKSQPKQSRKNLGQN